jgi:membrane protein DedA with SNARE-associated domain
MIIPSLDSMVALLATYKYILLFPISIVEGPIVSVIAGLLCSTGVLSLPVVYAVLIAGDMVGDTLYYSIGRWGGRPFIKKWGYIFGLHENRVIAMENHFKNHPGKTLLVGKTQAIGGLFLAAAGLSKMSYPLFMWFNLIGTTVKSLILLLIGYSIGHAYKLIDKYLGYYAIIASVIFMAGIAICLLLKLRKKS